MPSFRGALEPLLVELQSTLLATKTCNHVVDKIFCLEALVPHRPDGAIPSMCDVALLRVTLARWAKTISHLSWNLPQLTLAPPQ